MKKIHILLILLQLISVIEVQGQGNNHIWLLGDQFFQFDKGRMTFDSISYNYQKEFRKMAFLGTEATLCDRNGNFLMSSNGVWIANATNDTMLNGGGLNPGPEVNSNPNGLLLNNANIFLPFPGDSTKYTLFHHTCNFDGFSYPTYELLMSVIDMNLDNGLGGVILKNDTVFKDTLSWGITACKHANGRDWWIFMLKNNSSQLVELLYTPYGFNLINKINLNTTTSYYTVANLIFSSNGDKLLYVTSDSLVSNGYIILSDFDRCSGQLSNTVSLNISAAGYLWGNTFSPSGNYIYANTSNYVFQIDVNTLQVDTVAIYDGFCFPNSPWCTTFWNEYLAANGKIYITSGSSVQHIHEMNYPDSAGIACDVQQHAIFLDLWNFRAVPNHPNYNLGPVLGSVCDSLSVGTAEYYQQIQNFQIFPNPLKDGVLKISYQLPQNLTGEFEVYDLNAKLQYHQNLPPWSSLQYINLPLLSNGMYQCVIRSGKSIVSKKLVMVR